MWSVGCAVCNTVLRKWGHATVFTTKTAKTHRILIFIFLRFGVKNLFPLFAYLSSRFSQREIFSFKEFRLVLANEKHTYIIEILLILAFCVSLLQLEHGLSNSNTYITFIFIYELLHKQCEKWQIMIRNPVIFWSTYFFFLK